MSNAGLAISGGEVDMLRANSCALINESLTRISYFSISGNSFMLGEYATRLRDGSYSTRQRFRLFYAGNLRPIAEFNTRHQVALFQYTLERLFRGEGVTSTSTAKGVRDAMRVYNLFKSKYPSLYS